MSERGEEGLKRKMDYERLEAIESKMLQMQIDGLRKDSEDHEKRLRSLEEVATQFRFILYLTAGGGIVGVLNLLSLVFLIWEHSTK